MDTYSLRSVFDLPAPFRSTFNFRYFNSLQSECFHTCFLSDVNMVVSAPTGSGKTVLFELCILKLLSRFLSRDGRFVHIKGTLKTIYIAPSKALVQEKLRDWNQKFGSWGVICLELTSDNDSYNVKNIQEADIILTTPEKFDAVSRYRIKDGGLSFFSDIALLLLDEVHLLNDPRGAALEAIVSRMKMLACRSDMKLSPLAHIRFIAVSATIPNLEDLAEWLMVPPQGMKRFGEEMRPVKLTTKVFGYAAAKNDFMFEKFKLASLIALSKLLKIISPWTDVLLMNCSSSSSRGFKTTFLYSRGKSALVFCSTRKGAQEAAQKISQAAMSLGYSNPFIKTVEQHERLREASLSCNDKQLQSYIIYGVGYHNGGLCMKDRNLIENLFLSGNVQVLCTTNTLAHGINLPAHTVIIKSTQHFNKEKGLYMEYDRSTILQMSGRAGRPPFNDTGMVIIMTRKETVHLYENLLNGCEIVESQLLSCMTEHLTAEIVQLTVPDITTAIEWMKCSYLYVRMKKNPENYGVKKGISKDRIERHMHEVCVQKVNELSKYQMIWTDEDGFLLQPLEPGKLMTKYYLKFDTMRYIMQTSNFSLEDVFHTVCRAEELSWIQLRRNEKKLLNDINADKDGRLRFHIVGGKGKRQKRIQTREEKIFVLANDCLTGDPLIHDLSLSQDMNSICSNGSRVAKCMKDYFLYKKNYKGALHSSALAKSLHQRLWDDSPYLLKQLPGIGMVTAKALHSMGVISFDTFAEADPRKIEIVTGRKYPFGNHIKESLSSLPPKVEMKIEVIESQRQGKLAITLNRLEQSSKRQYADMVVGMEEDNLVIYHEKIRVDEFSSPYSTTMFFSNTRRSNLTIKADLIYEEYVGIDLHHTLHVTNESNIDATTKNGSKKTSFPHPEGLSIVEDDDGSLLPVTLEEKNKSNEATTSMPTFELLDEESEEDLPANNVEEDECKIIDEKTVFDHIRRKAKDFPVLSTSDAINCPSPEATKLTKKRIHEMRLEFHGMVEVSERSGRNTKPRQFKVPSYLASTYADQSERLIDEKVTKQHMATGSLDIVKLVDDEVFSSVMPPRVNEDTTGSSSRFPDMPPQVNEDATRSSVIIPVMPQVNEDATGSSSRISSRKVDSIFDRLRRKTRNLPIMKTQIKYDPLITDHSPDNKFETSNLGSRKVNAAAPSNKTPSDTVTILDLEPSETEDGASVSLDGYTENHSLSSRRSTGVRRTLDLPLLSNASDSLPHHKSGPSLSPTKDIPSKPAEQSVEPRSAIHDQSLSGVIGQSSAPTKTADESNKKVDSFLGFKSIFSFL